MKQQRSGVTGNILKPRLAIDANSNHKCNLDAVLPVRVRASLSKTLTANKTLSIQMKTNRVLELFK